MRTKTSVYTIASFLYVYLQILLRVINIVE